MGLQVSIHGWIAIFPFHSWELSIMVGMFGFPTTIPNHIHCGAPPIVGWFINPTNYSYIPLKPVLTKLYILIYLAKALEPNHSMINTVIWLLSVNIDINELIPNIICVYINYIYNVLRPHRICVFSMLQLNLIGNKLRIFPHFMFIFFLPIS